MGSFRGPPRKLPIFVYIFDRPWSQDFGWSHLRALTISKLPSRGLLQPDFDVYEDGVRQTLRLFSHDDAPVAVGLVIDHSGSMRHNIPEVTSAARTFIQFSSKEDQMFVVNFNEHVNPGPAGKPGIFKPRR